MSSARSTQPRSAQSTQPRSAQSTQPRSAQSTRSNQPSSTRPRSALIRFPVDGTRQWLSFNDPIDWVVATSLDEVRPAMAEVQAATENGYWAVGMVSYDAGPAFDPAIESLRHHGVPLVAFGFYQNAEPANGPGLRGAIGAEHGQFGISGWAPSRTQVEHALCIAAIKAAIANGDTYQVNHTFRLRSRFTGDPRGLFAALARAQPSDYLAYLDLGRAAVCSASPEMFFERHGNRLITRPMKGTRPRAGDESQDEAMIDELRTSEKDRAENTMIVDMARNDLSRVADIGSVTVTDLHTVETYPTVHQLTSTVAATSDAGLVELFDAMFPAASITGAPKFSTTKIITELEREPRGIYTGTVGAVSPDGTAVFNVAIRTAWVDLLTNSAEYGIGGGIIWDSKAEPEWREALDKSRILLRAKPDLKLLETMRLEPGGGIDHLDRHLERLQASARHFGYKTDMVAVKEHLAAIDEPGKAGSQLLRRSGSQLLRRSGSQLLRRSGSQLLRRSGSQLLRSSGSQRLRLLVDWEGTVEVSSSPIADSIGPYRATIDDQPVQSDNEFLHHKTTERSRYRQAIDRASARRPDASPDIHDVILWNERGELTETTIGNLVLAIDGELRTPPLRSGVLPGTLRGELLHAGTITEAVLTIDDLAIADEIHMINSVRGWTVIELVSEVT